MIAYLLIPGKRMGQGDSDPRITWVYEQSTEKPHGFRIIIRKTSQA